MNVVLRDIQPDDRDKLLRWRNLPEVRRWMYTDHEIQPDEHEHWFADALVNPAKRFWVIVHDGNDVGLANLDQINLQHRRCSWAFYLADPNTRGQGVGAMTEFLVLENVFMEMNLDRLSAEVLSSNDAVVAMHESFGFRREGLQRKVIVKQQTKHDVVLLAILREEWLLIRKGVESRLVSRGRSRT